MRASLLPSNFSKSLISKVTNQSQWPGSTLLQVAYAQVTCSTPEQGEAEAPGLRGEKSFLREIFTDLPEKGRWKQSGKHNWCSLHDPYFKTGVETHPFQLNFSEHAEVLKASTVNSQIYLYHLYHSFGHIIPSACDILSIKNYSLYSALSAFHGGFGYCTQLHLLTSIF